MKLKKLFSLVVITAMLLTTALSSVSATSPNENQGLQIATEATSNYNDADPSTVVYGIIKVHKVAA